MEKWKKDNNTIAFISIQLQILFWKEINIVAFIVTMFITAQAIACKYTLAIDNNTLTIHVNHSIIRNFNQQTLFSLI